MLPESNKSFLKPENGALINFATGSLNVQLIFQ